LNSTTHTLAVLRAHTDALLGVDEAVLIDE
jgi:hypothetical protein